MGTRNRTTAHDSMPPRNSTADITAEMKQKGRVRKADSKKHAKKGSLGSEAAITVSSCGLERETKRRDFAFIS